MRKLLVVLAVLVTSMTAQAAPRATITTSLLEAKYGVQNLAGLGAEGPLGAMGPLGTMGPLGNNPWNPSFWMKAIGSWRNYATFLTDMGGPMSAAGPLGHTGPVGREYKNFPAFFKAGGELGVLGPGGVLGALGPLGPLGPMGGHGFRQDRDGWYHADSGMQVQDVSLDYDGHQARVYELVEMLSDRADVSNAGTSFMVHGEVEQAEGLRHHIIHSAEAQTLSVVVVPEREPDHFAVGMVDAKGKIRVVSDSATLINTIHIHVPANTDLKVSVKLTSSAQPLSHGYRLVVVGCSDLVCR